MYRIYLINNQIIVFDKPEKELKEKYGNLFEQIGTVKDQDNIDSVANKLLLSYKASEIILDCKIKKKFGWKYWDDETKQLNRKKISESLKKYKKTDEHKKNLSKSAKNISRFAGKKHTEETKARQSWANRGRDPIKGKKWMFNPITGKEKRGYELEPGMHWGRNPEQKDAMLYTRSLRKRKQKN